MLDAPVAVVGATGFTGRLSVAALRKRGVAVRAIGRNAERLAAVAQGDDGVEARAAHWDAGDLADALRGCAAMVSCAGPFAEVGHPVAEAAVRARVPYCDSTGEQAFIRWVFESLDAPARAAGVALVPAAGFDFVPGDCGAAIVAEGLGPLERLDVVYGVERADASVGTRVSGVGIMAAGGVRLQDGTLRPVRIGSARRSVDLGFARVTAGTIPVAETYHVPRHVEVRSLDGYLALPGALSPANPGAGLLVRSLRLPGAQAALRSLARRGPEGPDQRARQGRGACHVQAVAMDGTRRAVLVEGHDLYGFTAESLAEIAVAMGSGADATGACAPAQVIEPRTLLAACGWTVREVDPE